MQETQETQVQSLGHEDPLEEEMAPTPVFFPGKSQGQRSLAGYSPWGRRVRHDWARTARRVGTVVAYFMQEENGGISRLRHLLEATQLERQSKDLNPVV